MPEQPSSAEIQEFWEKCGCKIDTFPLFLHHEITVFDLVFPDQSEQRFTGDLMKSLTLDNLFQWAVPAVTKKGYHIQIDCYEAGTYGAFAMLNKAPYTRFHERSANLADGLFRACREVLK